MTPSQQPASQYPDFSDEDAPGTVGSTVSVADDQKPAEHNCLQCRRKKRKCDRKLPSCGLCFRTGAVCNYTKAPQKSGAASPKLGRFRTSSMVTPSPASSMQDEEEDAVYPPNITHDGSLSQIDPNNLYLTQTFSTLRDFKQYVFDIARLQGWTPYLRRSDRRGAEVRCHSMPNPYKPRTVEFNQAGCQFRVAARTWPEDRKSKAYLLQDVDYNTPGRWGDGTEPARVTMIQSIHICGKVDFTGRADDDEAASQEAGETARRESMTKRGGRRRKSESAMSIGSEDWTPSRNKRLRNRRRSDREHENNAVTQGRGNDRASLQQDYDAYSEDEQFEDAPEYRNPPDDNVGYGNENDMADEISNDYQDDPDTMMSGALETDEATQPFDEEAMTSHVQDHVTEVTSSRGHIPDSNALESTERAHTLSPIRDHQTTSLEIRFLNAALHPSLTLDQSRGKSEILDTLHNHQSTTTTTTSSSSTNSSAGLSLERATQEAETNGTIDQEWLNRIVRNAVEVAERGDVEKWIGIARGEIGV